MTEKEFQAKRRMWAIVDGQVLVADPGDARSHADWFSHECWTDTVLDTSHVEFMEQTVRGFYLPGRIVAYRRAEGNDFSHYGVAHMIAPHLAPLATALGAPDETEVWVGARVGDGGAVSEGYTRVAKTISAAVERLQGLS